MGLPHCRQILHHLGHQGGLTGKMISRGIHLLNSAVESRYHLCPGCVCVHECVCETARQPGSPETWTFSYTVIASKKTAKNALTFLPRTFLVPFPFLHTDFRLTCLVPGTGPFKNRDVFVFDYMNLRAGISRCGVFISDTWCVPPFRNSSSVFLRSILKLYCEG